jgi:hypothetical protein
MYILDLNIGKLCVLFQKMNDYLNFNFKTHPPFPLLLYYAYISLLFKTLSTLGHDVLQLTTTRLQFNNLVLIKMWCFDNGHTIEPLKFYKVGTGSKL